MNNNTTEQDQTLVNVKTMTDDMKLWFSRLQYLESDDIRSIIKVMHKHLKSVNDENRKLSLELYEEVSNGNDKSIKTKEIELDIINLVQKMKDHSRDEIQDIFYFFRYEFDSVMGSHSIDKIAEQL